MPLDADDERQRLVFYRLDDPVAISRRHPQSATQSIDCLLVQRIDSARKSPAQRRRQACATLHDDSLGRQHRPDLWVFNIEALERLVQRAVETDVQQLLASADAEDGQLPFDGLVNEFDL